MLLARNTPLKPVPWLTLAENFDSVIADAPGTELAGPVGIWVSGSATVVHELAVPVGVGNEHEDEPQHLVGIEAVTEPHEQGAEPEKEGGMAQWMVIPETGTVPEGSDASEEDPNQQCRDECERCRDLREPPDGMQGCNEHERLHLLKCRSTSSRV